MMHIDYLQSLIYCVLTKDKMSNQIANFIKIAILRDRKIFVRQSVTFQVLCGCSPSQVFISVHCINLLFACTMHTITSAYLNAEWSELAIEFGLHILVKS